MTKPTHHIENGRFLAEAETDRNTCLSCPHSRRHIECQILYCTHPLSEHFAHVMMKWHPACIFGLMDILENPIEQEVEEEAR